MPYATSVGFLLGVTVGKNRCHSGKKYTIPYLEPFLVVKHATCHIKWILMGVMVGKSGVTMEKSTL